MRRSIFALMAVLVMAAAGAAWSAVPQLVNYQGEVTDINGPINGTFPMEFRIFPLSAGGGSLWSEAVASVGVSNGRFNVILGQVTALPESIFDGNERWLEIVFNGETMPNRVRLVTVPYAHRISTVDGSTGGDITDLVTVTSSDGNDSAKAVHGILSDLTPGQYSAAVRGENRGTAGNGIGVWGSQLASGWGVYGTSTSGRGVFGAATSGHGVSGTATTGHAVSGSTSSGTGIGVYGENSSSSANAIAVHGVLDNTSAGSFSAAIRGENRGTGLSGVGVYGSHDGGGWGVYGVANSILGRGVYGESDNGVGLWGHSANNLAGYFSGSRVQMTGGTDASAAGAGTGFLVLGQTNSNNLVFDNNEIIARNNGVSSELHLQAEGGTVMIGAQGITAPTGYILAVDGKAIMEEVEVQLSGDWPDYVFEDGYELMPLDLLAQHVRTKKHLPGIPSENAMKDARLPLGEMQTKLLEKVEELTLYILQLEQRLAETEKNNAALRTRVDAIETPSE